jgi:type II secretion system protein N
MPNYDVTISAVKPTIPPGLNLESVGFRQGRVLFFEVSDVSVSPILLSLFGSGIRYRFAGNAYDGNIKGIADMGNGENESGAVVNSNFNDIRLDNIPALQRPFLSRLTGTLSGFMTARQTAGESDNISLRLRVNDCNFALANPLFDVKDFTFRRIEADLEIKGDMVSIKRCKLSGTELDGNFNGSIQLRLPLIKSELNLNGTLKPYHTFFDNIRKTTPGKLFQKLGPGSKGFPIRFQGTIESPVFALR